MEIDYTDFSYHPDYGYKMYCNGTLENEMEQVDGAVCFSRVFGILGGWGKDNDTNWLCIYTLRCRRKFKKRSGNYCSMNKEQVLKILRFMRRSFDIKISFAETEDDFIFKFTVEGKPIKHKFVLTFSRVFFEFPYNEIAREALRMREMGVVDGVNYANRSFLELYSIVHAVYQNYMGGGHSLFLYPSVDVRLKIARDAFEEGRSRVHSVYPGSEEVYKPMKKTRGVTKIDWNEGFEERVVKYSENFKIIKKLKNDNKKNIRRRARKALQ